MDLILSISADKKWVRIGPDIKGSNWYLYDTTGLKTGMKVESYTHELRGNQKVLTSLTLEAIKSDKPATEEIVNKDNTTAAGPAKESPIPVISQVVGSAGISDKSISKLAVALTLVSMQGMIDPSNIDSMIDSIYKKYNSI